MGLTLESPSKAEWLSSLTSSAATAGLCKGGAVRRVLSHDDARPLGLLSWQGGAWSTHSHCTGCGTLVCILSLGGGMFCCLGCAHSQPVQLFSFHLSSKQQAW